MIRGSWKSLSRVVIIATLLAFIGRAVPSPISQADDARQTPSKDGKPVASAFIDGIVVDEQGRAVSGVTIQTNRSCRMSATTTTRADGTFHFQAPWPFEVVAVLIASSADGTRQGSVCVNRFAASSPYRIVLRPSREVEVHVADSAGKPVSDATVYCLVYNYFMLNRTAKTDLEGKVRLRIPLATETTPGSAEPSVSVAVFKSGVGMDYFNVADNGRECLQKEQTAPDTINLVLNGAAPLEVDLIDSDGKPLSGLTVKPDRLARAQKDEICLRSMDGLVTDIKGRVRFDWLPTDLTFVKFSAWDGNYTFGEDIEFRIREGGSRERLAVALRKPAQIAGRVTTPDGKPAAGILVQAEGVHASCDYFRNYTRTDADGMYSLRVDPNEVYLVGIIEKDWAAPTRVNLILTEGENRENLDFRLAEGTLVHGRITVGPEKRPYRSEECKGISSVAVIQTGPEAEIPAAWSCSGKSCTLKPGTAVKCHPQLCRWTSLDAKGRYTIRLSPGEYKLRFPLDFGNPVAITVANQRELVENSHTPQLPFRRFRIRTVDASGRPVPDCVLTYYVNLTARTDNEGRLTKTLERSDTALYARNGRDNLAGFKMVPQGDKDEVEATIEMRPAAKLTGRVVDAAGHPIADAYVFCSFHRPQPRSEACFFRTSTKTGRNGKFVIAGLFPNFQAELAVSRFDASTKTYDKSETMKFDVKSGENQCPDVVLQRR